MQFAIRRSALLTALQRVYGIVPVRSTLPLLQNFLLTASENGLEITATDLEVSVRTTVPLTVEEHGALAIPARLFFEVIRELPETEIRFATEGLELVAHTDRGVYRFPGMPKEDFPTITVARDENGVEFPTPVLARMVTKGSLAVAADPLRLVLTGVLFYFHDGLVEFVSTDGKKLVRIQRRDIRHWFERAQAVLPTKALNLYLRNTDASDKTLVYLAENHVVFDLNSTVIYCKQIASKYPSYEKVIPTENPYLMRVNKDELTAAIKRVSVFASSLGKAVQFSVRKDKLALSAQDIEYGGQAYEELAVSYEGPDLDVAYNGQYLLEVLRHMDTEEVHLRFQDAQTAVLVVPSEQQEHEDLLTLVMPIQVAEVEAEEEGV